MNPEDPIDGEISINAVTESDLRAGLDRLIEVYFSAYEAQPEYAYRTPGEVVEYIEWLYEEDPPGFSVARRESEIVAWSSAHDSWRGWRGEQTSPSGELQELVITAPLRRRGLGRRLLQRAVDHTFVAGRSSIGLWVGEHNEAAKSLYLKYGFLEESRWKIWIRMIRPLSPASGRRQ